MVFFIWRAQRRIRLQPFAMFYYKLVHNHHGRWSCCAPTVDELCANVSLYLLNLLPAAPQFTTRPQYAARYVLSCWYPVQDKSSADTQAASGPFGSSSTGSGPRLYCILVRPSGESGQRTLSLRNMPLRWTVSSSWSPLVSSRFILAYSGLTSACWPSVRSARDGAVFRAAIRFPSAPSSVQPGQF